MKRMSTQPLESPDLLRNREKFPIPFIHTKKRHMILKWFTILTRTLSEKMKVWLLQDHQKGQRQRSEIACHKPWHLSARTSRRSRKPRKTKRRSMPKSLAPCEFFSEAFHQVAYHIHAFPKYSKWMGFPLQFHDRLSFLGMIKPYHIYYPLIIIDRFSYWDCIHFPSYLQGDLAVTRRGFGLQPTEQLQARRCPEPPKRGPSRTTCPADCCFDKRLCAETKQPSGIIA